MMSFYLSIPKKNEAEDVSEIFSFLMRNYTWVMRRAEKSKILAEKVKIIKEMIYDETNGRFDQTEWERVKKMQRSFLLR